MKNLLVLFLLSCIVSSANAQVKLETGLLIGGGKGSMSVDPIPHVAEHIKMTDFTNNFHFSLGYRFRFKPVVSRFFFDLDLNAGIRSWDYKSSFANSTEASGWEKPVSQGDCVYISGSLAATANYKIYRGLSVGAGIQPTYYFYQSNYKMDSRAMDFPLLGKVSYNFRFAELSVGYKFSPVKSLKSNLLGSTRFNDWQVSVYIPF